MYLVSLHALSFEPPGLVQGVLPQGPGHASEGAFDAAGFQDRCQPGWWEAQMTIDNLEKCWDMLGYVGTNCWNDFATIRHPNIETL